MNKKDKSWGIIIGLSLSILLINITAFAAWTPPTQAPPGGNVSPPLNISAISQVKSGALGIEGVLRAYSNLIVDRNVGIGTTTPAHRLDVKGNASFGTAGTGTGVLEIIQSGQVYEIRHHHPGVTWRDISLNPYYGNVGIGTRVPQARLDVAGAIRVGFQDICNANTAGAIRYISTPGEPRFEGCNAVSWLRLDQPTVPPPPPPPPPPRDNRVFVTSSSHTGNFGGLLGADQICAARAGEARLGGNWRAILSLGLEHARDRIGSDSNRVVNMRGQEVAKSKHYLWGRGLQAPIAYDEHSQRLAGFAWTNTERMGTTFFTWEQSTCGNFLREYYRASTGSSESTNARYWIDANKKFLCWQRKHLYCIEQ